LLHGVVTLAQVLAAIAVVAGGVLWMRRTPATTTTVAQAS
jgi:hypothetical protein